MDDKRKSIRDLAAKFYKDPQNQKSELLGAMESMREAWTRNRQQAHHQTWIANTAFHAGNHHIRDVSPTGATYRVRLRENHTNNHVNRMLSVFTQNLPITRVFPNSIDWSDVQRAENTEAFAKYFWRTSKIDRKIVRFLKHTIIVGNGFMVPYYDPDAGGEMLLDETETKSGDPEIRQYRGDIRVDVDPAFRIAVRPGIEDRDDMYDFIRSKPVNRYALEAKYGKIDSEGAQGYDIYTGQLRTDDDLTMQHHYFHEPTPWFEEGLYACWTGKTLLRVRPASICEKKLSLIHLPFDQPYMGFWGMAPIEQVLDLQEQLNRAGAMIVEARNLVARPRVTVSQEAQVPGTMISDAPGSIIRWKSTGNPAGGPKFEVPNFNFAELAAHKKDLRDAMGMVIGNTSASRGEIPTAIRTALALQLVLEQDRSQFVPFIKEYHQAILDMMNGVLSRAAEYFDEEDPRTVKIEGDTGVRTFHGKMVPSPLDLYLEDTNPLGWTASGRIEQVGILIDKGLIKDRHQALEMLSLRSSEPAFELTKINRDSALRENELLSRGRAVEIGPEDDDAVHLDEHIKPLVSFQWRKMPKAVLDVHIAHVEAHKQRFSQNLAASAGAGASPGAAAGGPPPKASGNAEIQDVEPPAQAGGERLEALLQPSGQGG